MSIVITGIGQITPGGRDIAELLDSEGHIPEETRISDTQTVDWIPRKHLRKLDHLSRITAATVAVALADAGLGGQHPSEADETGLLVDTQFGSAGAVTKVLEGVYSADPVISPLLFPNVVANAASGQASICLGLRGPSSTLGGLGALMYAFDLLMAGRARRLVVGASDEISGVMARGLEHVGVGSASPAYADGAAFVVLEHADDAVERGAVPYAELCGVSMATDPDFALEGVRAHAGGGVQDAATELLEYVPDAADEAPVEFLGVGWPGTGLRDAEVQLADRLGIRSRQWPKQRTGELFAGSNALNIVLAASTLGTDRARGHVLASGYDSSRGQTQLALLKPV